MMLLVRVNEQFLGERDDKPAQIAIAYGDISDYQRLNDYINTYQPYIKVGNAFGGKAIGFWHQDEYEHFEQYFKQEKWTNGIYN